MEPQGRDLKEGGPELGPAFGERPPRRLQHVGLLPTDGDEGNAEGCQRRQKKREKLEVLTVAFVCLSVCGMGFVGKFGLLIRRNRPNFDLC
jgi:hypothetical protein